MATKDEIKNRVLTENTAQGVFHTLRELESNRASMLTRWAWELLQNARDASTGEDTQLIASVTYLGKELVFQHNGRGFNEDEVGHLIFHGSTKSEDEETIGQYGTGFLTTHLLSAEINVRGNLEDGRAFEFNLNRRPDSIEALRESMDESWDSLYQSLTPTGGEPSSTSSTEFHYPIESSAIEAVEMGIENLKQAAPFVVAFNQQFSRIEITTSETTSSFEVVDRESLERDDLQEVTVRESKNGNRVLRKFVIALGTR